MFGRKKRSAPEPEEREVSGVEATANDESEAGDTKVADVRANGPWDESELPGERSEYLDLGCVLLKPVAGLAVRMDLEEETQRPRALNLDLGEGSVQVQAFTAPKSSGLWDDVRRELVEALRRDGGQPSVKEGPLGLQVDAKFPATTATGGPGYRLARFVGVDGPRWFLRAVYTGAAAMPTPTADALDDVVRSLVIVRGRDPRPPRDLLTFQIPDNATVDRHGGAQGRAPQAETADEPPVSASRRGPEITEIG